MTPVNRVAKFLDEVTMSRTTQPKLGDLIAKHVSKIVSELPAGGQAQLCRIADCNDGNVSRWQKGSTGQISRKLRDFVAAAGYDPASIASPELRPLIRPDITKHPLLDRLAVALASGRLTERQLVAIDVVLNSSG